MQLYLFDMYLEQLYQKPIREIKAEISNNTLIQHKAECMFTLNNAEMLIFQDMVALKQMKKMENRLKRKRKRKKKLKNKISPLIQQPTTAKIIEEDTITKQPQPKQPIQGKLST